MGRAYESTRKGGGKVKMSRRITRKRVENAVRREMFGTDNPGFCLSCGEEQEGCEPDARDYECNSCGKRKVYGAAEIMLMMPLGG